MDFTQLPAILTPDIGLLFWMLLAFLVVFCALAKFGFPVITKTVEERKNFIDESLRKAHEANERLENIQVEGEKILQSAREKQSQILREAAETRDNIVEKAQQTARAENARLLEEGRQEIAAERSNVEKEIRAQVADLSVKIAEKVLRQQLELGDKQMARIDKLLDEIPNDNK